MTWGWCSEATFRNSRAREAFVFPLREARSSWAADTVPHLRATVGPEWRSAAR
jgi:hypothetical protein